MSATKSRAAKYYPATALALAGIGMLALPALIAIPWQFGELATNQKLSSSQRSLRYEVKERAKTANFYKETEQLPSSRNVILTNFIDRGKRRPKINSQYLNNLLDEEVVVVYDASRKCVGLIQERKFIWRGDGGQSKICQNFAPILKKEEEN